MSFFFKQVFLLSLAIMGLTASPFPWMGVSLEAPDEKSRVGTEIEAGMGLAVRRLSEDGPLAKAGGRVDDLWWKFEGQILVSRRQLMILLQGKKSGEEVSIDFYREGVLRSLKLVLEDRPTRWNPGTCKDRGDGRNVVLTKREQAASLVKGAHHLTLRTEGDGWRFLVTSQEKIVLEVTSADQSITEDIPARWLDSFMILRLSLVSSREAVDQPRSPRVRYLPRTKEAEKGQPGGD